MARSPRFKTADVLQLLVEDNATGPVNQINNPSGQLGGWGWVTPIPGTVLRFGSAMLTSGELRGAPWLSFDFAVHVTPMYFYSENAPANPGDRAGVGLRIVTSSYTVGVSVQWLDDSDTVLGTASLSGTVTSPNASTASYLPGAVLGGTAPVGTTAARLRFDVFNAPAGSSPPTPGGTLLLREVCMLLGDPATFGSTGFLPDVAYVNVLGSAHNLSIERDELDVGTLTATILDSDLDPSKAASIIRPGRRVRVVARIPATGFDELDYGEGEYGGAATDWSPIFTGKVLKPAAVYDLLQPESKRCRITMTAVDAGTALTRNVRKEGVSTLDELPYVLEGCGVPWNVNGSGNQVVSATVVSTNESATALDQVVVARDSALGYAWVDRFGVLQVWDADRLPVRATEGGVTILDEGDYHDIDLGYDTDVCVNQVRITFLRLDPATGDTDEVPYGPYRDEVSIRAHDVHEATYTVQGLVDDEPSIAAYAQAILDANAAPRVRCNTVTLPIQRRRMIPKALVDLYDLQTVSNTRAGYSEALRVVGVTHSIDTSSWNVTLSFVGTDRVAISQATPAPSLSAGGTTLRQQLRPVGEVTMFYGPEESCPPGWLVLDGSAFDEATYPALAALLGGNVLPSMVDRFPIGAGTKALGDVGGDVTVLVPAHTHPVTAGGGHSHTIQNEAGHTHNAGALTTSAPVGRDQMTPRTTGGNNVATQDHTHDMSGATASAGSHNHAGATGTVTDHSHGGHTGGVETAVGASRFSVLNPFLSIYFIIRAV